VHATTSSKSAASAILIMSRIVSEPSRSIKVLLSFVLVFSVFCLAAVTVINLQTQVTGVLPQANGGTGGTTYSGVPSGMIGFINTGTCPTGWTEQSYSGDYLLMTVAANGDAGGTGGSTSYTPAGSVTESTMAATGTKFTTSSSGTAALTAMSGTTIASGTGNTVTLPAHTFTGTGATIQPPFVKLIACQKN
jgi:hypothetical protein